MADFCSLMDNSFQHVLLALMATRTEQLSQLLKQSLCNHL
jgi:hypothetical protein